MFYTRLFESPPNPTQPNPPPWPLSPSPRSPYSPTRVLSARGKVTSRRQGVPKRRIVGVCGAPDPLRLLAVSYVPRARHFDNMCVVARGSPMPWDVGTD